MIELTAERTRGQFPEKFAYCHGWNVFTRMVLPCTRWLRAHHTRKYMRWPIQRHLDVGCGDGYFLKRSPARERIGIDELMGDSLQDLRKFPAEHFDCVTMLAVIEHLERPEDVLDHVWPVMKTGGKLILTTPRLAADRFIRMYVPNIEEEHETYFERDDLARIFAPGFELSGYHRFILGLNQAFCFVRKPVLEGYELEARVSADGRR